MQLAKSLDDLETETITITRNGLPPIQFTGKLLGSGSNEFAGGNRANRWTTVNLYLTKGGKFIAAVTSHTVWQGEHDYTKSGSFATAEEAIEFLKNEDGALGRVSQEAVEDAAKCCPEFAKAWVEVVD